MTGAQVVRFGHLLRRLRGEAGLTVLEAAEAVGYGNYERWEAGSTKVGPQYLGLIADALMVEGEEQVLLMFAWLVDRVVPTRRLPTARDDLGRLRGLAARLPARPFRVAEASLAMGGHASSAALAEACVLARYGQPARDGTWRLDLPPTRRSPVPDGSPVLVEAYGEVFDDLARTVGIALMGVADGSLGAIGRQAAAPLLAALTRPGALEAVLDAPRGPAGLLGPTGRLDEIGSLAEQVRAGAVALAAAASGPDRQVQVDELLVALLAGDLARLVELLGVAAGELPGPDRAVTEALAELLADVEGEIRAGLAGELGRRQASVSPAVLAGLLELLRPS